MEVSKPTPPVPMGRLDWVPFGASLRASGLVIPNAATYTSASGSNRQGQAIDPSEIVQSLPAVQSPDEPPLNYWPWYQLLTRGQRWTYLSWLAAGRTSLPPEDGYLFIYYYGLERRTLVDQADLDQVIVEVLRLLEMHIEGGAARSRSFRGYSQAFLWHLAVRDPQEFAPKHIESMVSRITNWDEESLGAMLSWCVQTGRRLSASLAFALAAALPKSQRSVVTRRVGEEFRVLFSKRYAKTCGDGIELRLPIREGTFVYRPASSALSPDSVRAPSPWELLSQFDDLSGIWNSCVSDLQGLSRASLTAGGDELTVEKWQALPPELRQGTDHPLTKVVFDLVSRHASDAAECIVQMGKLAEVVGVEKRPRLTPTQSKRVAQVFYDVGYAVEPDARLTGQAYDWDEDVAVFLRTFDQDTDSARYAGAAWTLRLGLAVALADGSATDEEVRKVTASIDELFDLNDADRRRLEALRSLLIRSASDLSGLGKRVQEALPVDARQGLGRLLVAVAAADGFILPKELSSLRKCYRALGLGPELLDRTIAELAPASDEGLVAIQAARAVPGRAGEPIPPPTQEGAIQLDRVAIRRILAETEQVRRVLVEAMTTLNEPEGTELEPAAAALAPLPSIETSNAVTFMPTPTPLYSTTPSPTNAKPAIVPDSGTSGGSPTALPGLSPRFMPFYEEIATRPSWPLEVAKSVARRHKVMLSGAVDAINEISLETQGRSIIFEDGDHLTVETPTNLVT